MIFFISDLIDDDVPEDLRFLRPRHDVSLLHVSDPLENLGPQHMVVPAFDPEAGTSSGGRRLEPEVGGGSGEGPAGLERAAGALGISYVPVSTVDPITLTLATLFNAKRFRRSR